MTYTDMFERIRESVIDIDERKFINALNNTLIELDGKYGDKPKTLYISDESGEPLQLTEALTVGDENILLPIYHDCIRDNILFQLTNEAQYKSEFLRKADEAYLNMWRRGFKGRTIKYIRRR